MSAAMDPRESFLLHPDVSDINIRGVEFARREIANYCNETIDLIYSGVSAYLEADREFRDRLIEVTRELNPNEDDVEAMPKLPKGEVVGVFVQQDDEIIAPQFTEAGPVRTFYTKIEPVSREEEEDHEDDPDAKMDVDELKLITEALRSNDKRYMKLHVPVGERSIFDLEMPELREVNGVYVEYADGEDVRWFSIQRDGYLYEYVPQLYQSDQLDLALEKRQWEELINEGVPTAQATIVELFQHIVDWKTVPQALRTIK